jgi:hypothetical protein
MSRWHKMDGVADLPDRAFSENKFTRTYEGGGGGSQSSTSYQTNLPAYAQPFYEEMMARAQGESIQPYTPFTGDRTADFSQQQKDIQTYAAGLDPSAAMTSAQDLYNQLATQKFDAATAKAGMDPYMQAVVDEQKKQMQKDYAQTAKSNAAQAIKAGAFGGGREGAQIAVAQDEMLDRMAMAQAQGLQQAYQSSRDQFNQMQNVQMQTANAQQTLADAQTRLKSAVGAEQKAEAQKELDLAYEEFLNARDNERQNLAFYNALLRGIPVPTQSQVVQYSPTNTAGQLAGLGIAGLGAYNAMG